MTSELRLGIHLVNFAADGAAGWERLLANAEAADRAGIDKLVVSDHVVFGEQLDDYARPELGGLRDGRQPTGPDGHWLEPLTLLTFVAARTTRVRLATHVLLAALRRPVVLAKTAATLDVLSGGRLDLGVGVGWQRAEYDAAGLDFDRRGALLDECLDTCRALWVEQRASLRIGGTVVHGIHQMPKPMQAGGVPLWFGGTVSPRLARRLALHGAGWIPWGDDAGRIAESIPAMRRAVAGAGGEPAGLRVVGTVHGTLADAEPLVEAGVTDVIARIALADGASPDDVYGAWAEEFTTRFG